MKGETFKDDVSFLRHHVKDLVLLSDKNGQAQVAVAPLYQGRVMTSASDAAKGLSYGWVNRKLITSGKTLPHITPYGGEDRFWIGPEGGQFSVFFEAGAPFDIEHWFTPSSLDKESFPVVKKGRGYVQFRRGIKLVNYSNTRFDMEVDREIQVLEKKEMASILGLKLGGELQTVAFESVNRIKNTGREGWNKKTGLLSIWILGMLKATPSSTVVVPYKRGPVSKLGSVLQDEYFGKVPANRLAVKDGVAFFKADANYRSKIGLSRARCKPFLGSYDSQNDLLTLVQFTLPTGRKDYVNSLWAHQKDPFNGDVSNSYNDGPSGSIPRLGKFYELETSSPALALAPGESATHRHRTFHFEGPKDELDPIARALLGVGLEEIKGVFNKKGVKGSKA
jgi:hypothetical protein